jgi:mannitol-specific phosphotransferase system IIBC component
MEEYTPESQEAKIDELKRWFQDNLRIVISVLIVIVIAGGIYSYSKRTDSPIVSEKSDSTEQINKDDAVKEDTAATISKEQPVTTSKETKPAVSSANTSKETGASFVETAGKNDGLTVLARRATANYLEKNADSSLTKEHKIYIEDYLRKNVGQKGGVHIGTSVEFSKDLIQKAITQSKTLNEKQLKNLQKYSARVSSLS